MKISLIVAMATNGVIGRDNQLPWHLPNDLKYFKQTTLGKPVVMGRKTYESIGRPLPGRLNIVVTRQSAYQAPNANDQVRVVPTIEAAIELASKATDAAETMIIGGAQIYEQALPMVQTMYLTEVQADVEGDAVFPTFDRQQWQLTSSESHAACERNPYDYQFNVYERVG